MFAHILYQGKKLYTFCLSIKDLITDIDKIQSIKFTASSIISFDTLKKLCDALKNNTSVQLIMFAGFIRDQDVNLVVELLKVNKTINTLCISGNTFSEKGLQFIFEALSCNNSIKNLNLSNIILSENQAESLANAIRSSNSLEVLSIRNCSIDDVKVLHIARAMKLAKSLKSVDFTNNEIRNEGILAIAKAVAANKSLETLYLNGLVIQESAAKFLAESMIINYKIDVNHLSAHKLPTDKSARKALSYMVQGKFPQEMLLWLVNNKDRFTNTLKLFGISETVANAILDDSIKKYKFSYNLNKEGSLSSDLPGFTFGEYFLPEEITQQISSCRIMLDKPALQDAVQQAPGL